ncbi:MAG TPA: flagellar biosynthesis anti-sigma factor FlgM [Phycisphaerae bacterium]|jgi:hypothetical protein
MVAVSIQPAKYARDVAGWIERVKTLPEVRAEKVQSARDEIRSGRYEHPGQLDSILAPLAADLFGETAILCSTVPRARTPGTRRRTLSV